MDVLCGFVSANRRTQGQLVQTDSTRKSGANHLGTASKPGSVARPERATSQVVGRSKRMSASEPELGLELLHGLRDALLHPEHLRGQALGHAHELGMPQPQVALRPGEARAEAHACAA